MASQMFIAECEDALITARSDAERILQAIKIEQIANDGKLEPSNLAMWSTTLINAKLLRDKMTKLYDKLAEALVTSQS